MALYRCEEWQGGSGCWYCEHTSTFPQNVQMWVVPSRILGISPADFIQLLVDKFKPDNFYHNEDYSFVGWSWKSQAQMRAYKNWINAEARKKNFQV